MHSNSTDIANKAKDIFNTVTSDDTPNKIEAGNVTIFRYMIDREETNAGRVTYTREVIISIEDKTLESEYNKVFICKYKYPVGTLDILRHNKGQWEDTLNRLHSETSRLKEKITEAKNKMRELSEEQSRKMEYSKFCNTSELRDVYRQTVLLNQKSEDISRVVREAILPANYNPERSIAAIDSAINAADAALRKENAPPGNVEPPGGN